MKRKQETFAEERRNLKRGEEGKEKVDERHESTRVELSEVML